jgi:hypothetical protein
MQDIFIRVIILAAAWAETHDGCMPSNPRGSVVFLFIGTVFAIFAGAVLSTLIYDNSAAGIGYVFGEFVGIAFIPMLVAFFASRKSGKKATAFGIAIGLAAALLLVSSAGELREAIDGLRARTALQGVHDLAGIEKAARENPSNHLVGLFAEAWRSAQETESLANAFSASIEPAGLAANLNPATASREQLQAYQSDLRTAEARANAGLSVYVDLMKKERERVERFGKLNGINADTLRNTLEGIDKRHARTTAFTSGMLDARAALYKALADRFAILIEQYGKVQVQPNGQFVFADRSVLPRFNATVDPINNAAKRIAELEEQGKQLQSFQQEGLKRAFSGQ